MERWEHIADLEAVRENSRNSPSKKGSLVPFIEFYGIREEKSDINSVSKLHTKDTICVSLNTSKLSEGEHREQDWEILKRADDVLRRLSLETRVSIPFKIDSAYSASSKCVMSLCSIQTNTGIVYNDAYKQATTILIVNRIERLKKRINQVSFLVERKEYTDALSLLRSLNMDSVPYSLLSLPTIEEYMRAAHIQLGCIVEGLFAGKDFEAAIECNDLRAASNITNLESRMLALREKEAKCKVSEILGDNIDCQSLVEWVESTSELLAIRFAIDAKPNDLFMIQTLIPTQIRTQHGPFSLPELAPVRSEHISRFFNDTSKPSLMEIVDEAVTRELLVICEYEKDLHEVDEVFTSRVGERLLDILLEVNGWNYPGIRESRISQYLDIVEERLLEKHSAHEGVLNSLRNRVLPGLSRALLVAEYGNEE
jgi:hypothetical protein